MAATLFEQLDLNRDGELSRSELYNAAVRLGWHWREAPFFALLDLLTLHKPISADQFDLILKQATTDPLGPYGSVLLDSPHFTSPAEPSNPPNPPPSIDGSEIRDEQNDRPKPVRPSKTDDPSPFQHIHQQSGTVILLREESAMLILDPQFAFTQGVWMQSIGPGAETDVKPIRQAFKQCRKFLIQNYGRLPIMFTRCPFPPQSYQWDNHLAEIIDRNQLYFIKPGNSVLFPPTNGFKEWVDRCIQSGRPNLVIGGCTLNSCVRVSAVETQQAFRHKNIRVVVDTSLCGARARNLKPSVQFGGISAVDSAVKQMLYAGVSVVSDVDWK
jgi:hypothetical protein